MQLWHAEEIKTNVMQLWHAEEIKTNVMKCDKEYKWNSDEICETEVKNNILKS